MKEYTVPGPAGDMTVMLSDDEAKARGLTPSEASQKAKPAPANKARTASNKADA